PGNPSDALAALPSLQPPAIARAFLQGGGFVLGGGANNGDNFQLFDTKIDLAALGLSGKMVQSITFTKLLDNGTNTPQTGIFAVSGTPEQVIVSPASPTLTTTPNLTTVTLGTSAVTLQDTATLSGGYNPTGTITFTLYQGSTLVHTETVTVS